jgi:hypothetical protein
VSCAAARPSPPQQLQVRRALSQGRVWWEPPTNCASCVCGNVRATCAMAGPQGPAGERGKAFTCPCTCATHVHARCCAGMPHQHAAWLFCSCCCCCCCCIAAGLEGRVGPVGPQGAAGPAGAPAWGRERWRARGCGLYRNCSHRHLEHTNTHAGRVAHTRHDTKRRATAQDSASRAFPMTGAMTEASRRTLHGRHTINAPTSMEPHTHPTQTSSERAGFQTVIVRRFPLHRNPCDEPYPPALALSRVTDTPRALLRTLPIYCCNQSAGAVAVRVCCPRGAQQLLPAHPGATSRPGWPLCAAPGRCCCTEIDLVRSAEPAARGAVPRCALGCVHVAALKLAAPGLPGPVCTPRAARCQPAPQQQRCAWVRRSSGVQRGGCASCQPPTDKFFSSCFYPFCYS